MKAILALWRVGALTKYIELAAIGVAVFFIGFAWGQHSVTKTAVSSAIETVQTHADQQYAQDTAAIAGEVKSRDKRFANDAVVAHEADDAVHKVLDTGREAAERGAAAARAQLARERAELAKQKERVDGLLNVNAEFASMVRDADARARAIVDDSALCGSADTRRVLDEATGAEPPSDPPGDGAAGTDAAGGSPEAGAAGTASAGTKRSLAPLTCGQLREGAIQIGKWGRNGWTGYSAWQAFFDKRFPPRTTPEEMPQ